MGRGPVCLTVERNMRLRWIVLGLLLLMSCKNGNAFPNSEEWVMDEEFLLGFSSVIDRFYRKTLTVDHTGRCELVLESNLQRPESPEIGHYVTHIPAEEALKMRDRMQALARTPLPDPEPMVPGQSLMEIYYEAGGKRQRDLIDPYVLPKRHQVVGRQIAEIEASAGEDFVAGLRIGFDLGEREVMRDQPLRLTVRMMGVGSRPVCFVHPLNPGDDGDGRIALHGKRSDVSAEDSSFLHRRVYDFSMNSLVCSDPALEPGQHVICLTQDNPLVLTLEGALDWPPGAYLVKLSLDSTGRSGREGDMLHVRGGIVTAEQPLVVRGEARPEDEGDSDYEPPVLLNTQHADKESL